MSFDEWYLPKKHFLDDCESGYFECYEAGAVSRQDEVSKLQTEIDELQKRIDNALKELELIDCFRTGNSDKAIKILKGESNE